MTRDDDLLGIPFAELNCWELCCEKLLHLGWPESALVHPEEHVVAAATSEPTALDYLVPPGWQRVAAGEERVGDLVGMGLDATTHFGIVDQPGWVLHTRPNRGSHLSRLDDLRRQKVVRSVWRIARC